MSTPYSVKPDREFLRRVLDEGGDDLKKCYQCATCSVVCKLSNEQSPFPRKEMIWAQWGLKDRLVADPDVWLCHQCNDCSTRCPRGARPGDVLAAVRQETVRHYAVPKLLGRCAGNVKCLWLMLLAPAALLAAACLIKGPIRGIEALAPILHFLDHDPEAFYAQFFPHWLLIAVFSSFTILAALAVLVSLARFWKAMKAADESSGRNPPPLGIVAAAVNTLKSILTHDKFSECESQAARRLAHLGAFYGFAALFVVTTWAVLDLYLMPFISASFPMYPFGLMHPMKILANLGCAALIFGCVKAISGRLEDQDDSPASTSFDWVFVGLLLGVGVSGLLTEICRFAFEPMGIDALKYVAWGIYFVHLVLVFDLLVYLPYSKFAHIVYRTVALVYAEHSGRTAGKAEKT